MHNEENSKFYFFTTISTREFLWPKQGRYFDCISRHLSWMICHRVFFLWQHSVQKHGYSMQYNGFEVVNPLHTWKSERLSFNRFKIEEGKSEEGNSLV